MKSHIHPNLLALSLLFLAFSSLSQNWTLTDEAFPTPYLTTSGDHYGSAVDIDGDYAVVGASQDSENGTGSGAAYVLHKTDTGWVNVAKLNATGASPGDQFGFSVSISGTVVVVGAPGYEGNGSAFLFIKPAEGWSDMKESAVLNASDASAGDQFGSSVSINGNTIIVGARYDDDDGENSGSAYVFETETIWSSTTETAKLLPSDGDDRFYFGHSVDVFGDQVVVGAFGDEEGSVYVFERPADGWVAMTQTAKLTSSDGALGDFFGYSVSMHDGQIVAGAPGHDLPAEDAGSAYLFSMPTDGWTNAAETAKLTASDAAADDLFGISVSIAGTTVVAGAYADDDNGVNSGAAYTFVRPGSAWESMTQSAKVSASDGTEGDNFGVSVSVSGNEVLVGARYFGPSEVRSGAAYFVERPGSSWSNISAEAVGFSEPYLSNSNDQFGSSVAIDGDYAVVGAPYTSDSLAAWGRVYVLEKAESGWEKIARLAPSDTLGFLFFGKSVSISGDVIVVGAPGSFDQSIEGRVYLFEKPESGWKDTTETAILIPTINSSEKAFGSSVAIKDSTVVVSANHFDTASGEVFVFEKPESGWVSANETAILSNSDNLAYDRFGASISLGDSTIAVGAPLQTGLSDSTGAVYVYQRPESGWISMSETAKLTSDDGAVMDSFGRSVAVIDNQIAVGAPGNADDGISTGAAYVFDRSGDAWAHMTQSAKLSVSDIGNGKLFGREICIQGDHVLVGAPGDESGAGSVYSYMRPLDGWSDSQELTKIEANATKEGFGSSIAVSGGYAVIGASQNSSKGSKSGAVYFHKNLNARPTFNLGEDPITIVNSGAQEFINWVTEISDGGNNSQALAFTVTNDNNALFAVQPAISTDGTLTYEPATDALGDVIVAVILSDDGGTEGGGEDTSEEQTFIIRIVPINAAPSFSVGADQEIDEDSDRQVIASWATNISDGGDETQALTFMVTNDNNNLFDVQPALDEAGTLSYTPAEDAFGTATVTVVLMDDGGTELGGLDQSAEQTFQIEIIGINDAPSISFLFDEEMHAGGDTLTVEFFVEDVDNNASELNFEATAQLPELIAENGLIFGGSEGQHSLSIVSGNEEGDTEITILVSDGDSTATRSFELKIRDFVAGIEDNEFSQSVSLYPNPANDFVTMVLPDAHSIKSLILYNSQGRMVRLFPADQQKSEIVIPVRELPRGVYLLMIESDKGIAAKRLFKN